MAADGSRQEKAEQNDESVLEKEKRNGHTDTAKPSLAEAVQAVATIVHPRFRLTVLGQAPDGMLDRTATTFDSWGEFLDIMSGAYAGDGLTFVEARIEKNE